MIIPLTPNEEFVRMFLLATEEHMEDVDKQGQPYIRHPLKVAHWLRTDDMQLMAIALGHDLVEDHGKQSRTIACGNTVSLRGLSTAIVA